MLVNLIFLGKLIFGMYKLANDKAVAAGTAAVTLAAAVTVAAAVTAV